MNSAENNGTHWVCLIVRNRECFYFDAFGGMCDDYVIKWCHLNDCKLAINIYIIQNLKSIQCGLFCVALFKFIKKEKIIKGLERVFPKSNLLELCNEYINIYEPDSKLNDNILFKYLRN